MSRQRQPDNHKAHFRIFGPAVGLVLIGFVLAYQFVQPAPPREIRISSGQPEGAYYLFAQRYRSRLQQEGITLQVQPSAGSIDNIQRLLREEAEVGLVQGGTSSNDRESDTLHSLGSLYFEPLWVFHRGPLPIRHLSDLRGQRVAIDGEGSGTRSLALRLLADNGINPDNTSLQTLGGRNAADALLNGELDSAFFVASPKSPVVQTLLGAPEIRLMNFTRAEAYTRTHRYLSSVVLPQGVIDMQRNIPQQPTRLLAASANLVVRADLHPALKDLLLQAAREVHGEGGWFEQRNQFPTPDYLAYPLSPEAERFYQYGPPLLQRYLPFWAATLVDRLKVMLLPFLALMIPLFKIMPPIYRWRMRSRIYRWYREVLAIDRQLFDSDDLQLATARDQLQRIEREVSHIDIPLSFAEELYDLRLHISLVQQKLERLRQEPGTGAGG